MRRLAAAFLSTLAALALSATAAADLTVGVSDDRGKYAEDGGGSYFAQLRGGGLTGNRVTVLWDAARPTTIVDSSFLDRSLPQAAARGVNVVFSVYPARPTGLTSSPLAPAQFAEFLQQLARTYPQVREYVVGNEPNQPRFWQPQFHPDGTPALGRRLRGRPGAVVRRAQGRRPRHQGGRRRPLRARPRQGTPPSARALPGPPAGARLVRVRRLAHGRDEPGPH